MATQIPMVPRKAPVGRFVGAMAGCPVWDAKKRRIEKQRDGQGLGLRWPPIDNDNQQSKYGLNLAVNTENQPAQPTFMLL